jgi:hypothetical protein
MFTIFLPPPPSHHPPHTPHFTPHTSHLTPHTSHFTPHTTHHTPHTSYRLLLSAFCFLLFSPCQSFAQINKAPQDAPHFVYQSSFSFAFGLGKNYAETDTFTNSSFSLDIQQLVAFQFNNLIFTGIGAGVDLWITEKKVSTFIPIFANVTLKFMDKKSAPFIFANVGYAFKWQIAKKLEENIFFGTKAGIYFQTGLGINIKFSEKLSLLFSGYYKMQQSAIQYREGLLLAETKNQLFHFAGIKIGLLY